MGGKAGWTGDGGERSEPAAGAVRVLPKKPPGGGERPADGVHEWGEVEGVEESDELKKNLVLHVRHEIGPIAAPEVVQFAPSLPKTRSGKIMRRILRKIAENETDKIGDVSTLADPSVVDALVAGRG